MQGTANNVEGITDISTMAEGLLLDALAAPIERIAGELDDMEGIHDGDRVGEFFHGDGFEPDEVVLTVLVCGFGSVVASDCPGVSGMVRAPFAACGGFDGMVAWRPCNGSTAD